MNTCIVPVRDQPELTERFLDCMLEQDELDLIIVLDNGSKLPTVRVLERAATRDSRLAIADLPGLGIYALWNAGADMAADEARPEDEINLLVANNDVLLGRGAVGELERALRSSDSLFAVYPDDRAPWPDGFTRKGTVREGKGVARDGGLYGPCFMVALDRIPWSPLISDPGFEWWFGDDHLARQIQEEGGRHGRVVGLPVAHENEGTARHHPETHAMRMRDRRRWIESQRRRRLTPMQRRRTVPGTKVWLPGGKRLEEGDGE